MVDAGCGCGGDCCPILAFRASLVHPDGRGAFAGRAAWFGRYFLSARRRDLGSAGRYRHCDLADDAPADRWERCNLRTIPVIVGLFLITVAGFAADQASVNPSPKLAAMLAAKDENGKAIITPEQQTYFNGLNDNLKELLNRAVGDAGVHAYRWNRGRQGTRFAILP